MAGLQVQADVVVEGGPQAHMGVVVLARPGQLPVRAREQCVGPQLAILFLRGPVFLPGRALSGVGSLFRTVLR